MRNPLSMFRRHQKVLLVVFGVVIVITFTIGGSIEYYQSSRIPTGYDTDVVVTWKHGRFREDDLMMMRFQHNLTVRFLDALVMRVVEAGGVPAAPGLTRDQTTGQIRDPGIPRSYAEEDLIQTAILARRAEEMGVMVSDQAILEFLDGLAAGKVPRNEFAGLLRDATGGRLIQLQLFEQLRTQLRAQNLRMMANSGLLAITPVSAWNYFNRLNRRIEAEMLPLPVDDFVSQVSREPTQAEIQSLYEEGKDRYPHPFRPEPGFKRPLKIAFQYLKADFERFLEAEMAKIDDDQVREYYEKNKQDFQVPEVPSDQDTTPDEMELTPPETDAQPDTEADTEADVEPDTEAKSEAEAEPESDTEVEAEPESEADDEAEPDAQPESSDEQSRLLLRSGDAVFVSTTAEVPSEEEPEAPAESSEEAEQPPAPVETDFPDADPAAEAEPVEDAPAAEVTEEQAEAMAEPEAEVQFRPLEDVADEIRRSIARPLAQDAMTEAMKNARREIDAYFRARVRAEALREAKRDVTAPAPLDLDSLGQKHQLVPGETGLVDALQIGDYELGRAYRFSFAQGQVQTIPFAQIAYLEGIPLFRADQIRSFEVDVEFLYWKAEEEQAFVPTLDEVRDEVIAAWKRAQALELAQAEAQRLGKAARSDKSLRETVGDALAERVFETGQFSWMTRGATPTGFGAPALSQIPGVEGAGHEFMESVFQLQPGETGVAVNEPQDTVFVVRLLQQTPDEGKRREDFLRGGVTFDTFHMAFADRERLVQDWYQDIQRQYNVQWLRTPEFPRDDW